MTKAAIDLYYDLLDALPSSTQNDPIREELRIAMWHSGDPFHTRESLCAVALKYDLPVPPLEDGIDIDAILARDDWSDTDAA